MVRSCIVAIGCVLTASACGASGECKCAAVPAPPSTVAEARSASTHPAARKAPADAVALARALEAGVPKPRPGQFETPEQVLEFLFETIASRDVASALVAFPIAEHYERVTVKDHVAYTKVFTPGAYPLDDDWYDRLRHALANYLVMYREVTIELLVHDTNSRMITSDEELPGILREYDGSRLTALQVVEIVESHPERHRELNPIDLAIGVSLKRHYQVTLELDGRRVSVSSFVGRVEDNWRVLFMTGR